MRLPDARYLNLIRLASQSTFPKGEGIKGGPTGALSQRDIEAPHPFFVKNITIGQYIDARVSFVYNKGWTYKNINKNALKYVKI